MLTGNYRDLFTAIATSAAALTGLLFVVVTVAESRVRSSGPVVTQEIRAAAALLSFSNALAISLFGLVPRTNVGYPAVIVGVIGILFSAAGMRSVIGASSSDYRPAWHLVLTAVLLVVFGAELVAGIGLLIHPDNTGAVGLGLISNLLVVSLLIGIARAWELVGGRDTGIIASLAVLSGHDRSTKRTSEPLKQDPDQPRQ